MRDAVAVLTGPSAIFAEGLFRAVGSLGEMLDPYPDVPEPMDDLA